MGSFLWWNVHYRKRLDSFSPDMELGLLCATVPAPGSECLDIAVLCKLSPPVRLMVRFILSLG